MQYFYHSEASQPVVHIEGDDYRYLFRTRRHRLNEVLVLRNLKDHICYYYRVLSLNKKEAQLELVEQKLYRVEMKKKLHIGWCVIDPKSVEKMLPTLNEIGVEAITFIQCQRSQASYKIDFRRIEAILRSSSQQCGRDTMMEIATASTLEAFLQLHPQSYLLQFGGESIAKANKSKISTLVVGCEGGITAQEEALFEPHKIVAFESPLVLQSQSAAAAAASMLLLG